MTSEKRERILLEQATVPAIELTDDDEPIYETKNKKLILTTVKNLGECIIKYDSDPNSEKTILHEAFIGLYATNQLRSIIPNFSLVHGFYSNKKCPSGLEGKCAAVIYEYIDGMDLFNYLYEEIKVKEIKQIILQLFLALFTAYDIYKFTHYDLHLKNIMIKKYDKSFEINYPKRSIKTKVVPCIIDYGRAHIILAGTDYGIEGFEKASFYGEKINIANKAFWPHDVFSILAKVYSRLTLDGITAIAKAEYDECAESIEMSRDTIKDLEDEFVKVEDTDEKGRISEEILTYDEDIQEKKEKMKELEGRIQLQKKRWKPRDTGDLVEIIVKLISYLTSTPEEKFNFVNLVKRYGSSFHITQDKKNTKLNFENFLDYTLEIIDLSS